jgi:hypothetical protein
MARGFDSKFVEAQQEEASRTRSLRPALTPEQQAREAQRRSLELSRARAQADLERARVQAHREMLEQAIRALDAQLEKL